MRILFVEDNPDFSSSIMRLLRSKHDVDLVDDADEFCRLYQGRVREYDLIILDLMMPRGVFIEPSEGDETGIAIFHRIRAESTDIPILLLSALASDVLPPDIRESNITKILRKPVVDGFGFLSLLGRLFRR